MQNQQGKLSYKVMIGFGGEGLGVSFKGNCGATWWGGVLQDNLFE